MSLQVLPLAITMMAGPQIMAAIILVTVPGALRVSLAFLAGVLIAATAGVAVTRGIFSLVGHGISLGDASDDSSFGKIVQFTLVALLAAAMVRNYLKRATAKPPKWLGTLMTAGPARAFKTGLLVILLMPSDIMVLLTVGANLEQNDASAGSAAVFILATVLIAALPLLALLLLHRRAARVMPAVREWMNTHSWVINILCCAVFIVLIV